MKLSWPIRALGAEIGGRLCLGTRVYWYVYTCIGMYRGTDAVYWYVYTCIGIIRYVPVRICMYWYVLWYVFFLDVK